MRNKVKSQRGFFGKGSFGQYLIAPAVCLVLAIVAFSAAGKLGVLQKLGLVKDKDLEIYQTRPIKFSHQVHAVKQELECTGCHTKAEKEDQAGMPSLKACRNCHDSDEDLEHKLKPFVKDNEANFTRATALSEDVIFSHKRHGEAQLKCEDCHKGIKESEAVSAELRQGMDDCLSCHAQKKVSPDCKTCHKAIDRNWKPYTHKESWKRFHGEVVRSGQDKESSYDNRCSLCHTDAACTRCHQDEQPQNHTNQWRERGHGIVAGMDRDKCAVCHRADFCDRCHHQTEPRSHSAGWGEPRNRHCLTCHTSLSAQGCYTCHPSTAWHKDAPERPDNITHRTASETACRNCHWLKPPHFDNGDSCRSCHR